MSDGYSRDRDDFEPHERGRIFENGTDKFFRDRENGYTRESRKYEFRDPNGRIERIQFDKTRNEHDRSRADSIEEKSGRIEGRKDEKQLRGIRELLERGEINHHTLRSVDGESISKECRELIDGLRRDYPERFTHQVITREDARKIWARGLEMELAPQLELPGVGEQARQQKERQRETRQQERARDDRMRIAGREQRARDRELAQSVSPRELNEKREQFRADVAAARKVAEPREKGQALEIDKLRESHSRLTKDLADIREIERAKAREMIRNAGLGREPAQELERHLEQNREEQRRDVTRELGEIGSTIKREDDRQHERETVGKQRERVREVRERAAREGVPREVMHVLEVGRIQPGEQPRAPEPDRDPNDHRAREAAKDRARVDERERQRRLGRTTEGPSL